jgi:hypothetical protein
MALLDPANAFGWMADSLTGSSMVSPKMEKRSHARDVKSHMPIKGRAAAATPTLDLSPLMSAIFGPISPPARPGGKTGDFTSQLRTPDTTWDASQLIKTTDEHKFIPPGPNDK